MFKFPVFHHSAIALIVGSSVALAIETPPDNAAPPAELFERQPAAGSQIQPSQSVAFLGITTEALPSMLSAHLDIEPGMGVVVRSVGPDTPASMAGLRENDLIFRIGEEKVSSPDQLTQIIRSKKSGEVFTLDILQKGKPGKVEVTLAERRIPLRQSSEMDSRLRNFGDASGRLRDLIERNLNAFGSGFPEDFFEQGGRLEQLRDQMERGLSERRSQSSSIQQSSTFRLADSEGSVEYQTLNGSTDVTVRDSAGKTVWDGPWNSAEDKAKAPEQIRQRIESKSPIR